MALAPPARILARAKEEGGSLTTLCSVCFNVIKRTNQLIKGDQEKREKINTFIEMDYQGDVQVLSLGIQRTARKIEIFHTTTPSRATDPNALRGELSKPADQCNLGNPFQELIR